MKIRGRRRAPAEAPNLGWVDAHQTSHPGGHDPAMRESVLRIHTMTLTDTRLPVRRHDTARAAARAIAGMVLRYRRTIDCLGDTCPRCEVFHSPRIEDFVHAREPVRFVLPAFPTKSPSRDKVLGHLPDLAEEIGLRRLQRICEDIEDSYPPGAEVHIASDGRVFNDVLGVSDDDVSAYQGELAAMIARCGFSRLRLFNLEDVMQVDGFAAQREALLCEYGTSMAELRHLVHQGGEALRLYRGITRFLFEDSRHTGHQMSNTARQNQARSNAYAVIQRSRAWGALIAARYPDAIRLSIHPQSCASAKLGIALGPAADAWLTPWHCVAVATPAGYVFMKRSEAEALGARMAHVGGRPSHYLLSDYQPADALVARIGRFTRDPAND